MVPFLDVPSTAAWVRSQGAEQVIAGLVNALEEDFRRWPAFECVSRLASHSAVGVIELMPISDGESYAFKFVNGHPSNPSHGLQTVTAFGVLADVVTGYPCFWAEMTILTALRTAATSALAARALARDDAATMALIGAGSQAEFQALGFRGALGIDRIRVWDTDPSAMRKLARNLEPLGFDVVLAASAAEAARGADVVTTCTADKANATVLPDAAVADGVHLNAVGGDCPGKTELARETVRRASIFVEHEPQTRVEGEIQALEVDAPVTALWEVLTGDAVGRRTSDEVTLFDSVGFALEDFTALHYVRDAVAGGPFVRELDLIADPSDPKDLYALVAAERASAVTPDRAHA